VEVSRDWECSACGRTFHTRDYSPTAKCDSCTIDALTAERDTWRQRAEEAEEVAARCGHNDQTLDPIHGTLTCTACGAVFPDPFHHNPGGG